MTLCVLMPALMWIGKSFGDRSAHASPVEIRIDLETRHQTITGWEATLDLSGTPHIPPPDQLHENIIDAAVNEIGISRVRLEVRSGAETRGQWIQDFFSGKIDFDTWKSSRYPVDNDNDDPSEIDWDGFDFSELDWHVETNLLPLMAKMEARSEQLWINVCYVSFIDSREAHRDPEEYAEFVLATYLHLDEKYGIVPDSWEVLLEPDLRRNMWTGKMVGEAIAATAPRLIEAGYEPAFVAPSVTDMRNAAPYIKAIAKVPGAMQYVREFSYHRYRGANTRNLREISRLAKKYGKDTAMLEWWFGRGNHRVLHEDLKIGNVSAWQGRVLEGHFKIQGHNTATPSIRPQKEVRYNLQYFKHVRNGAQRIGASSSQESVFDPLAFENPDGSVTVVIKADRHGEVALRGLPSGTYFVSYAVEDGSRERPEPISLLQDDVLSAEIAGAGVLTVSSHRAVSTE